MWPRPDTKLNPLHEITPLIPLKMGTFQFKKCKVNVIFIRPFQVIINVTMSYCSKRFVIVAFITSLTHVSHLLFLFILEVLLIEPIRCDALRIV